MPSPKHATRGSGGDYCCRCASSLGAAVKTQPTTCDGETYCPRCFVWWRMNQNEPDGHPRFNASQACVARCQFCDWTMMSFGALPGRGLRCFHCGRNGAKRVLPKPEDLAPDLEAIRATQADLARAAR